MYIQCGWKGAKIMIYLSLFLEFLKIGMFAFGGAYGAIPLIQETVIRNGWMNDSMFSNMVAISESTPGPIMVNAAAYIGNHQAGLAGAFAATLGVVLPSFIIILLITIAFQKLIKNKKVQMVLRGIKPCLMGVILATGLYMMYKVIFPTGIAFQNADYVSLLILILLVVISFAFHQQKGCEISPVLLIVISAIAGCILY